MSKSYAAYLRCTESFVFVVDVIGCSVAVLQVVWVGNMVLMHEAFVEKWFGCFSGGLIWLSHGCS